MEKFAKILEINGQQVVAMRWYEEADDEGETREHPWLIRMMAETAIGNLESNLCYANEEVRDKKFNELESDPNSDVCKGVEELLTRILEAVNDDNEDSEKSRFELN